MNKIEELICKYNAGECSAEEEKILEQWYQSFEWNSKAGEDAVINNSNLCNDMWEAISQHKLPLTAEQSGHSIKGRFFRKKIWYSVAAIILFAICGTLFFFNSSSTNKPPLSENKGNAAFENAEVLPGSSKAQLELANGNVISLDSARNMQFTEKDGTRIDKQSGKLVYIDPSGAASEILYNKLSTPRGGEYQLVLPDGSKVWLNAASSIKFPTRFSGNNRTVVLQGEAYFEVTSNKKMPFQVKLDNNLTVEVLGTHFNIMDYQDEDDMKTTLVEGKVKVTNSTESVFLSPSKQAVVNRKSQNIAVSNANIEKALAWKNGMIEFDGNNLYQIMRLLSRWYDVDVSFTGSISSETYNGAIRRQATLSKVLEILNAAGVRYKIEGKRLLVSGNQ